MLKMFQILIFNHVLKEYADILWFIFFNIFLNALQFCNSYEQYMNNIWYSVNECCVSASSYPFGLCEAVLQEAAGSDSSHVDDESY